MIIFLVGYMGCGKTSLGRKLARRLGCRFLDTDARIEELEGAEINDIFRYEGEDYFRKTERRVLEQIVEEGGNLVVSTGGGLPVWQDNMAYLSRRGETVYIRRPAVQIASRLSPYGRWKRPKLRGLEGDELVEFMTRDMATREPFYSQAKWIFDGAEMDDDHLLEEMISSMQKNG